MQKRKISLLGLLLVGAAPALTAPSGPLPTRLQPLAKQVVQTYVTHVRDRYQALHQSLENLDRELKAFLKAPTQQSLQQAKEAWKKSRDVYSETEAFRFYGGPIDNAEDGPEAFLNAWPIDESYIDAVRGQSKSGIVHNVKDYPKVEEGLLLSLNEKNGEKNISTGYHAVEFLLWGQDFNDKGPGQRPVSDYQKEKSGMAAQRRAEYLRTLSSLMLKQSNRLLKNWEASNSKSYGVALAHEPPQEALRRIFTGITTLTLDEMAGERMTVPLSIRDQENEQNCFSDYTTEDLLSNQRGIRQVWEGLEPLIQALDPKLAADNQAKLQASHDALTQIKKHGSFDQIIGAKSPEVARGDMQKAISALEAQSASLAATGRALGLELNVE